MEASRHFKVSDYCKQQFAQKTPTDLHPYTWAMERLQEGDAYYGFKNYRQAKCVYAEAVDVLEKLALTHKESLQYGLRRLACTHLHLFEVKAALSCFTRSISGEKRQLRDLESQVLMDKIKAARKTAGKQGDDYSPGLYIGHL